jgi:hypothetical protein
MGVLLAQLLAHSPVFVRRQALVQLFRATAAAFQCDMPPVQGLSREQCLQAYARFTVERAEAALRRGDDLPALEARLYENAYRLGRLPGSILRVHTVNDVMTLGRFLYGVIDIDFDGSNRDHGAAEITIGRCYFSDFYSPEVCQVMSAMDHGLLAGLAGGGDLAFSQRITEGQLCCRARFTLAAGPSSTRSYLEQTG